MTVTKEVAFGLTSLTLLGISIVASAPGKPYGVFSAKRSNFSI